MGKRTVQTLILLVDNEFGVLTRVTALVRREGWNIKSLAVAETMDRAVSRLTISVECLDSTLPHVLERIGKLACVRAIAAYSEATHFCRELVLVTVEHSAGAVQLAEACRARVMDGGCGTLTIEYSGEPGELDGFIEQLQPFGIMNVARSGAVTLERPVAEVPR